MVSLLSGEIAKWRKQNGEYKKQNGEYKKQNGEYKKQSGEPFIILKHKTANLQHNQVQL